MRYILILLICYVPISLLAQTTHNDIYASFINLNQHEGLSNNNITDLYQDAYGYVWIGTQNGLNRFDGNKFICFKQIINDSTSVSDNLITSITGDSKGNIWVGTANGLNKYNRRTGKFIRYNSSPFEPNSLRSNHVRKVALQSDSVLWVETIDGTLSQLTISTDIFNHFSHKPISQPDYLYHTLWCEDNGNVWIGGRNLEIHILDSKEKVFRIIYADPKRSDKKRDNDLAAILKTSDGVYYAAGIDGFYSFNPTNETFSKLYKSSTFSLCELPDGRVLLGTGSGLVIFNALENTFIKYINDTGNSLSLIDNYVNKVLVDKAGNIWAGTNNGISILKNKPSAISHYFYIPDNSRSLSSNKISSILKDSKSRIWIGTKDQGLNLWETTTNTFKHFKNNPDNPKSISSNNVTKIYEDSKGDIWIGLWAGIGFNKFYPEKSEFKRFAINKNSRKSDWYNDITEDSRGNFWLGIWGANGFQGFDRKTEQFLNNHYNSKHVPVNREIEKILSDGLGNLFIKTDLPFISFHNNESKLFETHISQKKYLSDTNIYKHFIGDLPVNPDSIYSMETNKRGITIFATDMGLLGYSAKEKRFLKINTGKTKPRSISYNKTQELFYVFSKNGIFALNDSLRLVSSYNVPDKLWNIGNFKILFDENDAIWVKSEKGIYKFIPEYEAWEEIDFGDLEYSFEKTKIIPIGKELFVSSETGLYRVDANNINKRTKIYFPDNPSFLTSINNLTEYNNQQVLIVSVYGIGILNLQNNNIDYININSPPPTFSYYVNGLASFKKKIFLSVNTNLFELDANTGELKLLNKPDKFMVSSRLTTCMLEDKDGNIWIGTSNSGLNKLNTKTDIFDHYNTENTKFAIPDDEITCLYRGSENTLYIGTNMGMSSFDCNTGLFKALGHEWNEKRIESIVGTSDSILWIGTNDGLIRYNTKLFTHQVFTESNGLPTKSYNGGTCILDNGHVVMATNQGIVTFDPVNLTKSNEAPKTEITGFNLFDKPVDLHIQSGDLIELTYNQNFFTIDFSLMNFDFPNSAEYSYNLTGMGKQWMSTKSPSVNFNNIPSGKYIFSVCKKGLENSPAFHSRLAINISPPIWKKFWFWFVIFILLGSTVMAFLINYIRQIKIRERNILLEQKLLTSQINPHFIFNILSAIQSFIYKAEPEVAGNYLSDFSRLVRLILENSRSELISLEDEIKTLKLYIGLQQLRFTNKFDFEIIIDPNINVQNTYIPPMMAQPFIENSIEHGIMHLKKKGNISICFGIKEKTVTIEVLDDGIGLKQSKLINMKREKHTSYASSITYERLVNLTRGGIKNIGIKITDRSETEGLNGTLVNIEVPFQTIVQ